MIVKDKSGWNVNIDVFLLNYIDPYMIDMISLSMRHALEDLRIPELIVHHNYLTNEDEFEIVADKFK